MAPQLTLVSECLERAPRADDSVEMMIGFMTEVGALLQDTNNKFMLQYAPPSAAQSALKPALLERVPADSA